PRSIRCRGARRESLRPHQEARARTARRTRFRGVILKAVIFDIGRVIVRVDLRAALEPLVRSRSSSKSSAGSASLDPVLLWQALESDPRWRDWQEGRMSPRQWHEHLTARLALPLSFEDFCAAWNRALHPDPILADDLF